MKKYLELLLLILAVVQIARISMELKESNNKERVFQEIAPMLKDCPNDGDTHLLLHQLRN